MNLVILMNSGESGYFGGSDESDEYGDSGDFAEPGNTRESLILVNLANLVFLVVTSVIFYIHF